MTHRLRAWLKRTPLFPVLRLLNDLRVGGDARQIALLTLLRPRGLFQPSGTTQANRYPDIFAQVKAQLGDQPGLRLLSFGCSTGEEVFTLADLFPTASIRGIDIAAARIRACRARWRRAGSPPRLEFIRAGSTEQEASGCYDAVFAMAVFRHGSLGSAPPVCQPLLDPVAAERALTDLARLLKPGGLLALRHANLRFSDLSIAAAFEPVYLCPPLPKIVTPIYGVDGRLRPGLTGDDGLYRKKRV